jgi:hypothetical protein
MAGELARFVSGDLPARAERGPKNSISRMSLNRKAEQVTAN